MRTPFLTALCGIILACFARAQEFGTWHVLGRFESVFDKNSTAAPLPPEKALKQMKAGDAGPDLAATFDGIDKAQVAWKKLTDDLARNQLDVGKLDLNVLCPPPPSRKGNVDNAVVYLYRRIDAEREIKLPASLGSDDGVRLWLNGELVVDRHIGRALVPEDDSFVLTLVPGANHLFVKVSNFTGAYAFQVQPRTRISQQAINDAIDRGCEFLIREQLVDGSWGCWEHWGAGHAAYVAYTLVKCGVNRDHPAVRMALALLDHRALDTTYARSTAMLALAARGDADSRERMQGLLAELIATQTTSGLWDYPLYPGGQKLPMDMSNTLYAALALRVASEAGLEIPADVWTKLAGGVLRCQEKPKPMPDGSKRQMAGFGYRIAEGAFGSVTTAGVSVLAICEQEGGSRLQAAVKAKFGPAKELGMNWLEANLQWSNNPGQGTGHHYFWVYGIERVGALMGTEKIGQVEWYWDGAAYLVRAQGGDGSWNPEGYVDHQYLDTCLALLFLKRATARGSGESSKAGVFETADKQADVQLRTTGDTPLTIWVSGIGDAANTRLLGEGGQLQLERIEYLARFDTDKGEPTLLGAVTAAPARRGELQRFALRHSFDRRGTWQLRARVHLKEPATGAATTLESPELAVRIDGVIDPAKLEYAADLGRNLFYGAKLKAESSSVDGGDAPNLAFDGNHKTRWRCARDDRNPWLRVTLERPARADGLVLSHGLARLSHMGTPRPRRVAVVVNKTEQFAVDMPDDVTAKARLSFGQILNVREIEVRIVESEGRGQGEPVGFSELELVRGR